MDSVADLPLRLSVRLGSAVKPLKEVLKLQPGTVVQLDTAASAPVELYLDQKLVARAELVTHDSTLGMRIIELAG